MVNEVNWCFAWFADSEPGSDKQGMARKAMWVPDARIEISFLDGTKEMQKAVAKVAQEWLDQSVTSLKFVFQTDPGHVRISFRGAGQWSMIGTECLKETDLTKATMNLGGIKTEQDVQRKTLHEFGHVLGLIHEHFLPDAPIEWDRDAVYNDLVIGRWTKKMVNENLFDSLYAGETNYAKFDPKSIMLYPIKASWTKNQYSSDYNTSLSQHDVGYISEMYGG